MNRTRKMISAFLALLICLIPFAVRADDNELTDVKVDVTYSVTAVQTSWNRHYYEMYFTFKPEKTGYYQCFVGYGSSTVLSIVEMVDETTKTPVKDEGKRYLLQKDVRYRGVVPLADNSASLTFMIKEYEGLIVNVKDYDYNMLREIGEEVFIEVEAYSGSGEPTYSWSNDPNNHTPKNTYIVESADKTLTCWVKDYSHSHSIMFSFPIKHDYDVSIKNGDLDNTIKVPYGEDYTIETEITGSNAPELKYYWNGVRGENSYTVNSVKAEKSVLLYVTNDDQFERMMRVKLVPDSGIDIKIKDCEYLDDHYEKIVGPAEEYTIEAEITGAEPADYTLEWKKNNYPDELIKEAIREATLNGVSSLRYIDKILYEWNKKGYKKKEDLKKNTKKEDTKEKIEIFDCDWLDSDEEI